MTDPNLIIVQLLEESRQNLQLLVNHLSERNEKLLACVVRQQALIKQQQQTIDRLQLELYQCRSAQEQAQEIIHLN